MSLVAYGASDSEGSDNESSEENDKSLTSKPNCSSLSDEQITTHQQSRWHSTSQSSVSTLNLVKDADHQLPPRLDDTSTLVNDNGSVHVLFKGLPIPKSCGIAADDGTDELEEEVRPKWSQIKDAPKPPKKAKQPVKISLPSISYDSDEEEQPVKKKHKPSSIKSGLTALLPSPVHVAKKEANRILIPYSMTRKNQDVSRKISNKPMTAATSTVSEQWSKNVVGDSDSDDDSPVNFFSLDSREDNSGNLEGPTEPNYSVQPGFANFEVGVNSISKYSTNFVGPAPLSIPDMSSIGKLELPSPKLDEPQAFKVDSSQQHPQSVFGEAEAADDTREDICPQSVDEPQTIPDNFMENEQFLRLQGKTQRRREEVNIVDVNADDFISTVDFKKNLSVEQPDHSHRKKDNLPSAQQRRKKQITYLAYQAKERELDLKNEWAQNRMTKRQTQSKYGF